MKLPRPLRALWQRFNAWLYAPFPAEDQVTLDEHINDALRERFRQTPRVAMVASPETKTRDARRVIADAICAYAMAYRGSTNPRLHVSREAWDAIQADTFLYAGCPVTVVNTAGRPGIWCDALPRRVDGCTVAGTREYPQARAAGMTYSDAPPTEAERAILAEFNGVELQVGASEEEQCESAETMLREYERGE